MTELKSTNNSTLYDDIQNLHNLFLSTLKQQPNILQKISPITEYPTEFYCIHDIYAVFTAYVEKVNDCLKGGKLILPPNQTLLAKELVQFPPKINPIDGNDAEDTSVVDSEDRSISGEPDEWYNTDKTGNPNRIYIYIYIWIMVELLILVFQTVNLDEVEYKVAVR